MSCAASIIAGHLGNLSTMKAKLLVLAALACSVVLAQEEDHTVRPFGGMGDIMSHLLQNVEGLTKHAPQQVSASSQAAS